jgi:murein DD-endopeptidase MepM/ murein hydrolase activator NlpD
VLFFKMHKIDDSFRQKKETETRARRRRRRKRRMVVAALAFVAVCLAAWFYRQASVPVAPTPSDSIAAPVPTLAPSLIDLPGDALRIELASNGGRSIVAIADVPDELRDSGIVGSANLLHEKILPTSQRLVASIPSTPQDFAFFQAQRTASMPLDGAMDGAGPAARTAPADATAPPSQAHETGGSGWSDITTAGLEGADAGFRKTVVENNVSSITLIAEPLRKALSQDDIRRVVVASPVAAFLKGSGLSDAEAQQISVRIRAATGLDTLPAGTIVAMRHLADDPAQPSHRLVQLAIYQADSFLAAFAVDEAGQFVSAADPWLAQNLLRLLDDASPPSQERRYRLLDGIYSVGLRNGIPSVVIGEAIMHLSRAHDLGRFASGEDSLTLLYADNARAGAGGQSRVLYVGVDGPETAMHCFVFRPAHTGDFSCLGDVGVGRQSALNGMVTPVAGVMTSTFGPRRHPILHKVLMHEGVDWAAPVGTPVRAAYGGRVVTIGDAGTLGNYVKIEHDRNRATGYAHLGTFAPGLSVGQQVKAGDLIGYVGTSGQSTGPHLHFELYASGKPIDPLEDAIAFADTGDQAVEALVDQIVRVESAGDAAAKNPLSTALGLGQFIEATWMRMMTMHRPDLAQSLDRQQILSLRLDPTLSREMVANLARENRSFLEAGGQTATAGRLYLAHFLGPEGARTVLSAKDEEPLETLLGNPVIQANPFLTGKNAAYVKNWADQKMMRRAVPQTRVEVPASPEFENYRTAVLLLVTGNIR